MIEVGTTEQDTPITFIPDFLDPETANKAFDALHSEIPWERRTTEIYGKSVPVPRMEVWVADYHRWLAHWQCWPRKSTERRGKSVVRNLYVSD
jgi:alkylated DNA repair dioxygenase AlkB